MLKKDQIKQYCTFWLLAVWLSVFAIPSYAVTVTKVQNLSFGSLVAGSGGTVTINPNGGARNVSGGVIAIGNSGFQPAHFTVTFTILELTLVSSVRINITTDASVLTGPSATMTGTTYTGFYNGQNYTFGTNICTVLLICGLGALGGTYHLYVGGTANVGANQPAGVYTNNILNLQVIKN